MRLEQSTMQWEEESVDGSDANLGDIDGFRIDDAGRAVAVTSNNKLVRRNDAGHWSKDALSLPSGSVGDYIVHGSHIWLLTHHSSSKKSEIHHYDGTEWRTEIGRPYVEGKWPALLRLLRFSNTDLWAVGSGTVVRYDGTWWSDFEIDILPKGEPLGRIWGTSPNDLWLAATGGVIYYFDGTEWVERPYPGLGSIFSVEYHDGSALVVGLDRQRGARRAGLAGAL